MMQGNGKEYYRLKPALRRDCGITKELRRKATQEKNKEKENNTQSPFACFASLRELL
jgi:hypothetical protein